METSKPTSILVVDDEGPTRALLALFFQSQGFVTADAGSASEALALVLQTDFDIVLTDIRMPRDTGLALLEKIRKYRPSVPVLLMTANPEMLLATELVAMAAAVLEKPFSPEQAMAVVTKICALKAGA